MDTSLRGIAPFARRLILALALAAAALALWRLRYALLLIFVALLLAVFIRLLADPLVRRLRLPDVLAVLISLLVILTAVSTGVMLAGAEFSSQFREVVARLPQAWSRVAAFARDYGVPLDPQTLLGGPTLNSLAARAAGAVGVALTLLGQIVVVLFAALFFALQPRLYREGAIALFPEGRAQERAREFLELLGNALKQWLFGQLTSMTIIGILVAVSLSLIGAPSALVLGVLTGIAEFVPYVGAISAGLLATLVALSVSPETALMTLLTFIVVQQLEGNVITPLVMRRAVRLAPAVNIFALTALASIFGPAGVFVAVPTAVVVLVAVKYFWLRHGLGRETRIPGEGRALH
jgi:predicted PurR-regulated permease PerM